MTIEPDHPATITVTVQATDRHVDVHKVGDITGDNWQLVSVRIGDEHSSVAILDSIMNVEAMLNACSDLLNRIDDMAVAS